VEFYGILWNKKEKNFVEFYGIALRNLAKFAAVKWGPGKWL